MANIEALRGTYLEAGNTLSGPVKWDFISTSSIKHGGIIGENGKGVRVDHFDTQLDSFEEIMSTVYSHKPHIVGLSVKIGALEQLDQMITTINTIQWGDKEKPLVVLGGVVPTFAPIDLLHRNPNVILSTGEGEIAAQMILKVARGERSFENVSGITYINGEGKVVSTNHQLLSLSRLHHPARITTKRVNDELNGMIWAEDSRGCDSACTFCSRRSFRKSGFSGEISPQHIVEDLEQLSKLGVNKLSFSGDDFCGDPERAFDIADAIIQEGIQMEWSISTRADHVFKRKNTPEQNMRLAEIMRHCKEAGLTCVFMGLESGSESQLKRYGKQITVEENYRAVEILQELGIDIVAGYIPIDYLMTVTELRETLEFLERTGMGEKLSNLFSIMRVQTGSAYLRLMEKKGLLGEKTEDLVFYKANFKDPRIDLVARIAGTWVEELYPLIFGLKSEVVAMTLAKEKPGSSSRSIDLALRSFRQLELSFFINLAREMERKETIDYDNVRDIQSVFAEKRRKLLASVRNQILSGNYGKVDTLRLISCLDEIPQ